MAAQCSDFESLVFTYLDEELAGDDAREFEHHLADCPECAEKLDAEERFHHGVRARLAAPPAPDLLRQRLHRALEEEAAARARGARRARAAWILPAGSVAVAAAALVLFVVHELESQAPPEEPEVARQAVRDLFEPMPSVVEPGSRPELSRAAQEYTRIPVRPPRFSGPDVRLRGFQRGWLLGHRAAVFVYEVRTGSGRHQVNVHTLDARDLDLRSRDQRVVGGRRVWASRSLGLSSVTYKDDDGIGYVFSSDMDVEGLVQLVGRSDLLHVVSDHLRGD